MRNRIQESLARLASRAYQHRFIVLATKEEYVLPDEMLDSTCTLIEAALHSSVLCRSLSRNERSSLERTLNRLVELQERIVFYEDTDSAAYFFEHNSEWNAIRDVAARCVTAFRFDLEGWESTLESNG